MVQSILKLNGIKELKKEAQKSVNGGFNPCPSIGNVCTRYTVPCFGGVQDLVCVNGFWEYA